MTADDEEPELLQIIVRLYAALDELTALCTSLEGADREVIIAEAQKLREDIVTLISEKVSRLAKD